jgi:hypothetical protein
MTLQENRKTNETLQVRTEPIQSPVEDTSANLSPNHEEIRLRAYEIYLERGGTAGNELDDWLQAERELERVTLPTAQALPVR